MPRKSASCYIIAGLIFKDEAGRTTINDAALYAQLRGQFTS
jgi:hypothetical protein